MPSWMAPTRNASRIAASIFWSTAIGASAERTAIEIALVGPLMSCRDESKTAPTAVITIAV